MTHDYQCRKCFQHVSELEVWETVLGDYCYPCLKDDDREEVRILGDLYADQKTID